MVLTRPDPSVQLATRQEFVLTFGSQAWLDCHLPGQGAKVPVFWWSHESFLTEAGLQNIDVPSEPTPDERKIQILQEFYRFDDHAAVTAFLRAERFLIDLLIESYDNIQQAFGHNAQVALEVFSDPETEGVGELFISIITNLSSGEAADALRCLDERWWLEASRRSRCLLNIDVEMV